MKRIVLPFLALSLAACATPQAVTTASADAAPARAQPSAETQFAQAATTPISDLNLVRAKIPAVLLAAQKAPYAVPEDLSCAALASAVQALDAALGADLDTPPTAADPGLVERGAGAVGEAAVGAVRSTAEGVVPFRSWVRKLTGAERHAREVAAAIAAGSIRRGYLKGLGQAAGCAAPASPRK
jgi:hypothetical protein